MAQLSENLWQRQYAATNVLHRLAEAIGVLEGRPPNFNDLGPTTSNSLGVVRSVVRRRAENLALLQAAGPIDIRLSYSNRSDGDKRVAFGDSELVADVEIGDGTTFRVSSGAMAIPGSVSSDWEAIGQLAQEDVHPSIAAAQEIAEAIRQLGERDGAGVNVSVDLDAGLYGQVMTLRPMVANRQIDPKVASGLLNVALEIDRVTGSEPVEVFLRWDFDLRAEDGVVLPDMMVYRSAALVADVSVGGRPPFTVATEIPRFPDGRPDPLARPGQTQSDARLAAESTLEQFAAYVEEFLESASFGESVTVDSRSRLAARSQREQSAAHAITASHISSRTPMPAELQDFVVADSLAERRAAVELRAQSQLVHTADRYERIGRALDAHREQAEASRRRRSTAPEAPDVAEPIHNEASESPAKQLAGAPLSSGDTRPFPLQQARSRRVILVVGPGGDPDRAWRDAKLLERTGDRRRVVDEFERRCVIGERDPGEGHLFGVTVVTSQPASTDTISWNGRIRDRRVADPRLESLDLANVDPPDLVIAYGNVGPQDAWMGAPVESRDGVLASALFGGYTPAYSRHAEALKEVMSLAHDPIAPTERAVNLIA